MTADDIRRAVRKAQAEYPDDPAMQERLLEVLGHPEVAQIRAAARRRERRRIAEIYRLAEDVGGATAERLRDRALDDDRPTAEQVAREVVG